MKNPSRTGLIIGALSLVLAFAGIFWYIGFTDNSALLKCIPKSAVGIIKFDVKSIGENAHMEDWSELEICEKLRNSTRDEEQAMFKLIKSPESSGINFFNNAYLMMNGTSGNSEVACIMGMADREEFEETLKRFNEDIQIERNDILNLVKMGYREYIVFNDDVIIMYWGFNSGESKAEERAKYLLTMDRSESMLENENFLDAESLGGDVSFYLNVPELSAYTNGRMNSSENNPLAELESQMDGYSTRITFEEGAIKIDSKPYYTEAQQNKIDDNEGNELTFKEEDLSYIAPKDPIAFLTMAFEQEEIDNALQPYLQLLSQSNISQEDIKKGFNGKISASLIDFQNQMIVREEIDYAQWDYFSSQEPPMRIDTTYQLLPVIKLNFGVKDAYAADQVIKQIFHDDSNPVESGIRQLSFFGTNIPMFSSTDDKYISLSNAIGSFELKAPESIVKWNEDITSSKTFVYADLKPERFQPMIQKMGSEAATVMPYWNMFDYFAMRGDVTGSSGEWVLTEGEGSFLWRLIQQINQDYKSKNNRNDINS